MSDDQKVYESLATHLDRLPAGFPRTPTGVELRILRRLFTPEEAELAQLLTMRPEMPEEIAARTGRNAGELAEKLEEMSRKGLIFRVRKGEQVRYMAAQFVIGIWEYHVNDLDPDFIRDANEYLPFLFDQSARQSIPQLRTIPVPRAITPEQAVMPYEQARKIIAAQEKILVAPCICRKEHQIMGKGCDRPMESCLIFGAGAQYYEENGLGRTIGQDEALKILEAAEKSGLVLQPSNSQKAVNICTCCGCCCQVLKNLKRLPEPAKYAASNYFAAVDADRCSGCETCLERCQMEAIRMDGGTATVRLERCIGCGLCVTTCPDEAIQLQEKPQEEKITPPSNSMETYKRIAMDRMARLKAAAGKTGEKS